MSFAARILTVIGLVALVLLAWHLRQVVLLLFGGLIVASGLAALASLVRRVTGLSHRWSVAGSVMLLLFASVAGGWLAGGPLAEQLSAMREQLPEAFEAVKSWLNGRPLGLRVLEVWNTTSQDGISWSRVVGAAGITLGALGSFGLMILLGIYLAAEPQLYRQGFLSLMPSAQRPKAIDTLDACADAMGRWLKGQGVSMLLVGTATGLGLALLGIPLALILGLIAGLLAFVPFFGPIASGLLAVLLAFTEGPETALYVAGLCILIQQIEGNLLMPFIQRWAVQLPPVLGLLAVVIFAGLFGLAGVLFATPLMVMLMVLVKKLYIENLLEVAHGELDEKGRQ